MNKHHTPPEETLQEVIADLEQSDDLNHPSHLRAVMTLLAKGPLLTQALLQALENPNAWVSLVRAELVAFLRQAVRLQGSGDFGYGISLHRPVQFFAKLVQNRVVLEAEGEPRDVAILQLLLLLDQVGLRNVRVCGASDCPHLFVKTYRREYCSVRCQKRTLTRKGRQAEREKAARTAARQQQRKAQRRG